MLWENYLYPIYSSFISLSDWNAGLEIGGVPRTQLRLLWILLQLPQSNFCRGGLKIYWFLHTIPLSSFWRCYEAPWKKNHLIILEPWYCSGNVQGIHISKNLYKIAIKNTTFVDTTRSTCCWILIFILSHRTKPCLQFYDEGPWKFRFWTWTGGLN